ncbi:glycosyltransferase family 4 protein [Carboxylicivirga taeanensis]|uniref:glycosyltransferase family 4 protein n=1 Tax=Carboxylicivirga taeanensis TaxID=1416875 RepID=UPI003F6DBA17
MQLYKIKSLVPKTGDKVKQSIIVAHGYFGRGGAEVSIMWIIEALKRTYDVHLFTRGGFQLDALNKISGTSLRHDEFTLIKPSGKLYQGMFGHAYFLRKCRSIGKSFDLRITGSRSINWGDNAIHFLSDVAWNKELHEKYCKSEEKFDVKSPAISKLLAKIRSFIAGESNWNIKEDIYVANSCWTAKISTLYTQKPPVVIYPAVPISTIDINWDAKQERIVCLGRISPEKRIEDIIKIVSIVREHGYDIKLHIVGRFNKTPYCDYIKQLCLDNKSWIILEGEIIGEMKLQFLAESKYGINACQREAFGISTAEMVQAGIIPFVPKQGAQQEIAPLSDLVFNSPEEAASKMIKIMANENLQETTRRQLEQRSPNFSSERFCREVGEVVRKIIEHKL